LLALLIGYAAAYIPALQISALQTLHRWRPAAEIATNAFQIQGIGWVGTRTPHFNETVAFFRDVLRLPLVVQNSQFVEFQLSSGERLGILGYRCPGSSFMKGPMIEFAVADVDRARLQLEASGVRFIGKTHRDDASGLAWAEFWGPDGYPYGLTSVPNQG
jgi:catechol 2,3-dioxygenase-like lactoylglutathione lyase family enzyme